MPPWSSLVLVAGLIVAVLLLIYGAQTAMREVGGAEQLGSALLFESAVAAARSCPPAGPVYFSRKGEVSCPLHELDFPIQSANIELDPKIWSYLEAPLKWKMMVFPSSKDWISQSATVNNGNQMFENFLKVFFYQALHPTNGTQVPESPLIIDVGANIGIHTLFFGALGYRTHAFEPVKATYALLACSVASNENMHSIVRVNNFGLSDKLAVGQCFGVQEGNQGHAYVDKGNKCDPSLTTSMTTMDFYWNAVLRRERPFLIKADIEGYEPFFFRGATEMLKTAPPVYVFMELSPFSSESYGVKVAQFLKDLIADGWKIDIIRGDDFFTSGRRTPRDGRVVDDQAIADLAGSRDGQIWDLRLTHLPTHELWKNGTIRF